MKRCFVALSIVLGFASGHSRADIMIGAAGPLTGQYAYLGDQMKAGAEQAVKNINAKGGINGQMLQLELADDACDPKQAVAVANKFAGEKVAFVAGHVCSSASIPASSVYAESGIIMISPASTNPKLTEERPGPGVFRVCGRDDQQGEVAGKFLYDQFNGKKIAFIDDKTAYGRGLAEATRVRFERLGGKAALVESYTAGEKDYYALVSKLKQAGADALYIGGYAPEVGLIVRQMRDQQSKTVAVSGDGIATADYWAIAGAAGEGTFFTFSPDPRKNPEAKSVVSELNEAGKTAENYTLYTYAAIQVWAQAVASAGSSDFKPVVNSLNKGTFDTVLGQLRFDHKGDVSLPGYVVYQWHGGNYDYYNK